MSPRYADLIKIITREIFAALGVLSLILLAVSHQSVAQSRKDIYRLADGSLPVICGLSFDDEDNVISGPGCDACRISGGIMLPDFPCSIERLSWGNLKVAFLPPYILLPTPFWGRGQFARGPPSFV